MTTASDAFQLEELDAPEVPASLASRARRVGRKAEAVPEAAPAEDVVVSRYAKTIAALEAPLDKSLVKKRKGYGQDENGQPKMLDYLEWHTVVRQLNAIFGYGKWTTEVSNITDIAPDSATGVPTGIRATVKLTVEFGSETGEHFGDTVVFENVGFGEVKPRNIYENGRKVGVAYTIDGYDMAVKTAVHDALKRCAVNLGERFGLGLYDKDADDTTSTEGTEETTSSANATQHTTSSRSASSAHMSRDDDEERAECEVCGRAIRGYTSNAGKTYTTHDLVQLSKKATGGHVFCYNHRQEFQTNRGR